MLLGLDPMNYLVIEENFYWGWIVGMSLLGIGTALVYPNLVAAISDMANLNGEQHP